MLNYFTVTWSVPQSENISLVSAFDVSQPEPPIISVNLLQSENRPLISVTLLVSNPLIFRLLKPLQPENIFHIIVTLLVSKLLTSMLLNPYKNPLFHPRQSPAPLLFPNTQTVYRQFSAPLSAYAHVRVQDNQYRSFLYPHP